MVKVPSGAFLIQLSDRHDLPCGLIVLTVLLALGTLNFN